VLALVETSTADPANPSRAAFNGRRKILLEVQSPKMYCPAIVPNALPAKAPPMTQVPSEVAPVCG
jgi:hypothetical protein